MKTLFALLLSLLLLAPVSAQNSITSTAKAATAILYSQDAQGTLSMHCTATAFSKVATGYRFVSAAHCAGDDDVAKEQVAKAPTFYVTFDDRDPKIFYAAKTVAVGYQHRGDDFLVVEVATKELWATVPIGSEKNESEGNTIINVAAPLGLGKQVFRGTISKIGLDRPVESGDINWRGVMLLQLPGTGGGSSGSSVISEKQGAIVGILVGTIGSNIVAIPASKLTDFLAASAAQKYRWARPADQ